MPHPLKGCKCSEQGSHIALNTACLRWSSSRVTLSVPSITDTPSLLQLSQVVAERLFNLSPKPHSIRLNTTLPTLCPLNSPPPSEERSQTTAVASHLVSFSLSSPAKGNIDLEIKRTVERCVFFFFYSRVPSPRYRGNPRLVSPVYTKKKEIEKKSHPNDPLPTAPRPTAARRGIPESAPARAGRAVLKRSGAPLWGWPRVSMREDKGAACKPLVLPVKPRGVGGGRVFFTNGSLWLPNRT